MNFAYDPAFTKKLKIADVRIRKRVKEKVLLFSKDPQNLSLNNHPLRDEWEGYRSIDITEDYRAIYQEKRAGDEITAYFVALGTHQELYGE